MPDFQIKVITSGQDMAAAFEIRRKVFRVEQGVPEEEEFDGLDDEARHYLLTLTGAPVGTARSRQIAHDIAKVERVALLQTARGLGLGRELMLFTMQDLAKRGVREVTVNAQAQVIPFYVGLNFIEVGREFIEAGIRHKKMNFSVASS